MHQTFTNKSSFCHSETVSVPMIPLGLKETKDIDMTAPLQVRSMQITCEFIQCLTLSRKCFPLLFHQDFISEHYGEDASLYLNEIRDFMELRQVS